MRRRLTLLMLLCLGMTLLFAPQASAAIARGWMLNASVQLYNTTNAGASSIALLEPGTTYDVIGTVGGTPWLNIRFDLGGTTLEGWVREDQMAVAPSRLEWTNTGALGSGFVLCESMSMREGPGTSYARVTNVPYATVLALNTEQNGWYHGWFTDGTGAMYAGWVVSDFILENPQYYTTTRSTAAYASPSAGALKVGQLEAGVSLPIITEFSGYYAVSLRGASAFIWP